MERCCRCPRPPRFRRGCQVDAGGAGNGCAQLQQPTSSSLRHPTLTKPPPYSSCQFAPTSPSPRALLSCFVLLHSSASSSQDGVPNARRCHGQVSSLAACGPPKHSRILTAYPSGTGYSKLGTMRLDHASPRSPGANILKVLPATTRPPSSSLLR